MNEHESEFRRNSISVVLSRSDVAFLLFISVFLFLQLFILPITPILFEGDHMIPVSNAMRLLDGEVMYRDFFHFVPPGADLYYAALFEVFGARIWILNATIFLLGIAQLALIFAFSKKLLSGIFVYLPTLLYFAIGFRLFGIDGSCRLFSVICVLLAAFLVMVKRTPNYLIAAGCLCGLASFFVQTRGLLGVGAIGLFLLWWHWKRGLGFRTLVRDWLFAGIPFLVVVFLTQAYFAFQAGFDNYYFANVTFLKDYYRSDTLSNFGSYFVDVPSVSSYLEAYGNLGGVFRFSRVAGPTFFYYAVVPLVYIVFLVYRRYARIEDRFRDEGLVLLSILGIVFFIGISALTALRLYQVSIPAMIILPLLISRLPKAQLIGKILVVVLCFLTAAYSVQRQIVERVVVDLPAGRTAFLSPLMAEKFIWLQTHVEPGEAIYEAQHPTFYFPMHLKNPTPFYLIRDNNYTPDFHVAELMRALEKTPPRFIIWHGAWSKEPEDRKPGDNLAPLWQFIRTNYTLHKEFRELGEYTTNSERDIEFWEKANKE